MDEPMTTQPKEKENSLNQIFGTLLTLSQTIYLVKSMENVKYYTIWHMQLYFSCSSLRLYVRCMLGCFHIS